MNCKNCAAPLTMSAGPLRMVCTFCHTVHSAPDVSQVVDRVQCLGTPIGVHCPVCDTECEEALIDDVPACQCPNCRGVLLSSVIFRQLVEDRRAAYSGPDLAVALPHPVELARQITCPSCHKLMEVHPYYGAGRAIIDSCAECQLVWIDKGELTNLERSPGRRSPAMMEASNLVADAQRKVTGTYTDPNQPPPERETPPAGISLLKVVGMLLG